MDVRLRVRRARRNDFDRVRSLLGSPPAAKADRKRWRRLVSTLREDLYLAEREDDDALVGLAVIVYARGLDAPAAIVRTLRGSSEAATRVLLENASTRAAARGCTRLEVQLDDDTTALAETLLATGWCEGPRTLVRSLSA